MKSFSATAGPFIEKPFFRQKDFEQICEDELKQNGLFPSEPAPVRIDRFVEKRFKIQPSYEDLPVGLLGFTRFSSEGVEEIVVSKALDDEGTQVAERRLRTTLAHESGHCLLHAHLFVLGTRPDSLFGDGLDGQAPKILCRSGGISGSETPRTRKPPYRWWEYQANQAMGVLLMPKPLVQAALAPVLEPRGVIGPPILPAHQRKSAIRLLADTFDVNPVVARLRLDVLLPAAAEEQLTL